MSNYRSAVINMPTGEQMGGAQPAPFVRFPFYPTSPWLSSNPNIGYQVRYYGVRLSSSDSDYQVGSETSRTLAFSIPCRVVAFNGASTLTTWATPPLIQGERFFPTEQNMNLLYDLRIRFQTEELTVTEMIGANIVGSAENPGQIGGSGLNMQAGAYLYFGITPKLSGLTINITVAVMEMRAPSNFSLG